MNCYLPWYVILPSLGGEGLCSAVLNGPYPAFPVPFRLWAFAFFLTLASEAAVLAAFYQRLDRKKLTGVLTANLLTHPAAIYLWIPFASGRLELSGREILLGAELTIPFLEALVYFAFGFRGWRRTLLASVTANLASWTLVAWIPPF